MTVKEVLGSLGSFTVVLSEEIPEEVRTKFGFFGHIAILRGDVDIAAHSNADLLRSARYVGVVRGIDLDEARELTGSGMIVWLGDEDEKGEVFESKLTLTNATLADAVAAILPDALTVGTVHAQPNPALRFTGSFQFVSPRSALQTVCDHFSVEFRVNGDGSVDVGTQANLYTSVPDSIVVRRGAGIDMDVVALGAQFRVEKSAVDYSSRILLVGQTLEDATFVTGAADAAVVPYRDLLGNPVKRTRMISESETTSGTVAARLQLQLNRFSRTTTSLKVTAEDYEVEGNFSVGDLTEVYDPDTGIVNASRERYFRGDVLHPELIRVNEVTWSITEDHTVAFRTDAGEWVDLTPWVEFETGTNEIVVGDLPRSLLSPSSNPILDRVDSLPDSSVPNGPTGLELSTQSYIAPNGTNAATIFASWTAPGANVDGTPLLDLSHYVTRYRPQLRAPQWYSTSSYGTSVDFPAVVGLIYDVQVAAVDKAGNLSDFTPIESITAAADTTAPGPPSDPTVSSYLGQLRIEWNGLTSTGSAMPPDFNRVDVHVGTTNGFTPSAATLVSSLSTKGVAFATAPYGATRYVRLIAYDHAQNPSGASGTISGATTQVADGDIAALSVGKLTAGTMSADVVVSGRFATALTGARTELNALGLQKFDASNNLLVNITGTDALLTGRYRSAISGRRIEMGAASTLGTIEFFAPDNVSSYIAAFTATTVDPGTESIRIGVRPVPNVWQGWPGVQVMGTAVEDAAVFAFGSYLDLTAGGNGAEPAKGFRVAWATNRGTSSVAPERHHRIYVEATDTMLYSEPSGGIQFRQWASGFGSNTARYWMKSDGEHIWYDEGQNTRFRIAAGSLWMQWPENDSRALFQWESGRQDVSALLQFANHYNYVARLRFLSTSAGASGRLELRDAGAGYVPFHCGPVTEFSSEAGKTGIRALDVDALSKVRALKTKKFRMKGATGEEGLVGEEGPETVGLIAEEAILVAPEIVTLDENGEIVGLQTSARVTLLERAVQQLAEIIETGRGKP